MIGNESKRHILVVDDNSTIRDALKISLGSSGYSVTIAASGEEAKELIGLLDFAAVITDIRMPHGDGIELLRFIKTDYEKTPVILMTGFSDIMETQKAIEIGAAGFLAKPFKALDLKNSLTEIFENKLTQVSKDSEFCKIYIGEFISGSKIKFDIFVRISESKYLKIAHSGEDLDATRLDSYSKKGNQYLYLTVNDFQAYLGLNIALSRGTQNNQSIDRSKKIALLKHTNEVMLEFMHKTEIDSKTFHYAVSSVESSLTAISTDSNLIDLLTVLSSKSERIYSHSIGVSLYAVLIARKLGWENPQIIFKLALGGLLHDVGKKEIDPAILLKKRIDLSVDEKKIIESHPTRGLELLSLIKAVPADVLQIVYQHHEVADGTGYPQHLRREKIHPLARLISLADQICDLLVDSPDSAAMSFAEALEYLTAVRGNLIDAPFMKASRSLIAPAISTKAS